MVYFCQLRNQRTDTSPKCHRNSSGGAIIGTLASSLCVQAFPSSKHSQLNDPISRARNFVPSLCSHLCLFSANNSQISWTNRRDNKYHVHLLPSTSPAPPFPPSPTLLKNAALLPTCSIFTYLGLCLKTQSVRRIGGKKKKKRKNQALKSLREGRLWVMIMPSKPS